MSKKKIIISSSDKKYFFLIKELHLSLKNHGVLDEYDFPILFDFPAGHEKTNYPIILGRKIKLDVTKSKSKVVFYN